MCIELAIKQVNLWVTKGEWVQVSMLSRKKRSEKKNEKGSSNNTNNKTNRDNRISNNSRMQDLLGTFHLEDSNKIRLVAVGSWWVAKAVDSQQTSLVKYSVIITHLLLCLASKIHLLVGCQDSPSSHQQEVVLDKVKDQVLEVSKISISISTSMIHWVVYSEAWMQICLTRTTAWISDRTTMVETTSSIEYLNSSSRCLPKNSRKLTNQLTQLQLKSYQW